MQRISLVSYKINPIRMRTTRLFVLANCLILCFIGPYTKANYPENYEKDLAIGTNLCGTDTSFMTVLISDDHVYLELPSTSFNRDILVVTRISKTGSDIPKMFEGNVPDKVNENVIRFEKSPSNKLIIRKESFLVRSVDTSSCGMTKAVERIRSFPILGTYK